MFLAIETLPLMQFSTNWATSEGDLAAVAQGTPSAHVTLNKLGDEAGPCTVTCKFQQPVVSSQLLLASNARMVEVSVQRQGDSTLSYLQTVRCQPQGSWLQGTISLQGAAGCSIVQLKLLSLQGDKSVCSIHQLQLLKAQTTDVPADAEASSRTIQQPDLTAEATSGSVAAVCDAPQQQPLSQLDELKMLIQQLHQPGSAGSSAAVPESLQLLHSKATEAPEPGASTAIKNLSAHIAQGMLFQAAQQRAQQHQQEAQLQQHQQEAQLQQQQLQQQIPAALQQQEAICEAGTSAPAGQSPPDSTLEAAAAAAGSGGDHHQVLLMVLQRLEAKVGKLAEGLAAGLQALDQRLARLEALSTSTAGPNAGTQAH